MAAQNLFGLGEARTKGLELAVPSDVVETPGEGIEGRVHRRWVIVGGLRFVTRKATKTTFRAFRNETMLIMSFQIWTEEVYSRELR